MASRRKRNVPRDYGWCKSAAEWITVGVNNLGRTLKMGRGRGSFLVLARVVLGSGRGFLMVGGYEFYK